MKYEIDYLKKKLYSGVVSDVLDQMGYRCLLYTSPSPRD